MSNQFREDIEEEEGFPEEEIQLKKPKKEKEPISDNLFFKKLFTEGVVSKEAATAMMPFLIFFSTVNDVIHWEQPHGS